MFNLNLLLKPKTILILTLIFITGFILGAIFQRNITFGKIRKDINIFFLRLKGEKIVQLANIDRREIDCQKIPINDKTMIVLVFGQSNGSNHGNVRGIANKNVYSFYDQKCYPAEDPLPGADGNGGSIWTRLGNKIIQQDLYENVIFASIGVGGSKIEQWTVNGNLHNRIIKTIDDLNSKNFKITHLFWHQGESDSLVIDSEVTSKNDYKKRFYLMLNAIRNKRVTAPIYVNIATRCYQSPGYTEIQQAQQELVDPKLGIKPGINTDLLGLKYRYDGCHFSEKGLEKAAQIYLEMLKNDSSKIQ